MNQLTKQMLFVLTCASLCMARSIPAFEAVKTDADNWIQESKSQTNDLENDEFYKETEIDIQFPESSRTVKVIIDENVKETDADFESPSSDLHSSSLVSSAQDKNKFDASVKRHMQHLLRNMISVLRHEISRSVHENRHRHQHETSTRRPRSRPKRSLRNVLRHVKDTNVAKILADYLRQKQGEKEGLPVIRFG